MVAATTILLGVLAVGGLVGGAAFLQELQNLLALIIGNFFYMSLIGVTAIVGGVILYRLVAQERITPQQSLLGFIIILVSTLAVPAAGVELGQSVTNYQADITVDTDQFSGLNAIEYASLEVSNIERSGPDIFNIGQQEACVFCGDWTVEAQVSCDDGDWTKTVTLSGQGGQSVTKTVEGMPTNSQCQVTGEMTSPDNPTGQNPKMSYFTTGE